MKIRKVDDKPMVIHTKEKAKIHAHEPKGAKIKGSNIYTVERGPKTAGAKVTDTDRKKDYCQGCNENCYKGSCYGGRNSGCTGSRHGNRHGSRICGRCVHRGQG